MFTLAPTNTKKKEKKRATKELVMRVPHRNLNVIIRFLSEAIGLPASHDEKKKKKTTRIKYNNNNKICRKLYILITNTTRKSNKHSRCLSQKN